MAAARTGTGGTDRVALQRQQVSAESERFAGRCRRYLRSDGPRLGADATSGTPCVANAASAVDATRLGGGRRGVEVVSQRGAVLSVTMLATQNGQAVPSTSSRSG